MTSEEKEAIEELKILKEDYWEDDGYGYATAECQKTITALDMAIEALEQKPCEDCISRQAVLDINEHHHGQMPNHINHEIWNEIKALPSVTPKEKTGRWISFGIQGEIDGQIVRAFTCSKCGAISIFRVSNGNIVNGDLCPNCGAKMQEVENDA